jgi:hypothetical protein
MAFCWDYIHCDLKHKYSSKFQNFTFEVMNVDKSPLNIVLASFLSVQEDMGLNLSLETGYHDFFMVLLNYYRRMLR